MALARDRSFGALLAAITASSRSISFCTAATLDGSEDVSAYSCSRDYP